MHLLSTLALLLLSTASFTSGHAFSVCKNHADLLGIHSLDFVPDPPQSGKSLKVRVQGLPSLEVAAGTQLKIEVKLYGVVMGVETYPLCDLVACPLPSGHAFDLNVEQAIPVGTPSHIAVTVKITVSSNQELSCLESNVQLESTSSELGAAQLSLPHLFQKWKAMFPKARANLETFTQNWHHIVHHNSQPGKTYTMEMNEFGSLTSDEFVNTRMGFQSSLSTKERARDHVCGQDYLRAAISRRRALGLADPPAELDWQQKGVVTPVKNQGSCGSCWAFSAIGSLESAYAIKTGKLVEFSEQELVSCDTTDSACQGGLMDNAFEWIEHNTAGLCTEEAYPYVSGNSGARGVCNKANCDAVEGSVPASYVDIQPNENALLQAIATHGPVSVAIEADQSAFQFYKSGVLTGQCGSHLDHGVLLVGYGVDEATGIKFWKVKNSWGAGWGEEGYIRIQRGKKWPQGGECGIASAASFPVFS